MRLLSIFPLAGFLVIVLLIALKTVLLKRIGVPVTGKMTKRKRKKYWSNLLFLDFLLLWIIAVTGRTFFRHSFFQTSLLTKQLVHSPLMTGTGACLIFLAIILMGVSLVHFKSSFRFGLNNNNQGKLITTGIFAFSRNPFFLSLNLYFIGQALIFCGILFLLTAFLAVTVIHIFIINEEKFLQVHYGSPYIVYMNRVRRYL